jgi:hypothetical protein
VKDPVESVADALPTVPASPLTKVRFDKPTLVMLLVVPDGATLTVTGVGFAPKTSALQTTIKEQTATSRVTQFTAASAAPAQKTYRQLSWTR